MSINDSLQSTRPTSVSARRRRRSGDHQLGVHSSWWTLLLILQIFNAVSAIGGGAALIFANGLGMPREMLTATPFADFVIPGLILAFVVGGTQLAAVITQWLRNRWYLVAAGVAGLGMIIWIYVEVAMLPGYSFLHTVYLASGVCQLVLLFLILDGWPRRTNH